MAGLGGHSRVDAGQIRALGLTADHGLYVGKIQFTEHHDKLTVRILRRNSRAGILQRRPTGHDDIIAFLAKRTERLFILARLYLYDSRLVSEFLTAFDKATVGVVRHALIAKGLRRDHCSLFAGCGVTGIRLCGRRGVVLCGSACLGRGGGSAAGYHGHCHRQYQKNCQYFFHRDFLQLFCCIFFK